MKISEFIHIFFGSKVSIALITAIASIVTTIIIHFYYFYARVDDRAQRENGNIVLLAQSEKQNEALNSQLKATDEENKHLQDSLQKTEDALFNTKKELEIFKQKLLSRGRLDKLIDQYLEKFSMVNIHIQCGDDEHHNALARQAKDLLKTIEVEAKRINDKHILNEWVWEHKQGMRSWQAICHPKEPDKL